VPNNCNWSTDDGALLVQVAFELNSARVAVELCPPAALSANQPAEALGEARARRRLLEVRTAPR
jgi:hypothetical protein